MVNQTQTDAAAGLSVSEPIDKTEMSLKEYQDWEREIQLGLRNELPNGQTISEFQAGLIKTQLEQEKTRAGSANDDVLTAAELKGLLEVTVHANGAVSATAVADKTAAAALPPPTGDDEDAGKEPDNDLPKDLVGRKALLAAGFFSLEQVAKFSHEELIGIPGVKDATAEKILDYGKSA